MSGMQLVVFEALDSLFFREAKPFNAGEGGFLDSQFPPSAQTLSGAIRSIIGEAANLDWGGDRNKIRQLLGAPGDNPAPLAFAGPYLLKGGGRLYPVPLNLLRRDAGEEVPKQPRREWVRLLPSAGTFTTDRGDLQLPMPESASIGARPIDEGWLDAHNMQRVLNGGFPAAVIPTSEVFGREARVGIGRDNRKGVVREGQLYFTRHIRLRADVALGVGISGATLHDDGAVRLGGEGRLARMVVRAMPPTLSAPALTGSPRGLILTLLTHGDFGGKVEPDWPTVHSSLTRASACVGKAVREGGWDFAKRQPKPLKSLVPAGSCYFVTVNGGRVAEVIAALHGEHIGQRTAFGYGEIAVGLWG